MNEKELFNAVGELDPSLIEEAGRMKRRPRFIYAAAAAAALIICAAAAVTGLKNRAAVAPETAVFYAVDGKLYRSAAQTTAFAARLMPASCTGGARTEAKQEEQGAAHGEEAEAHAAAPAEAPEAAAKDEREIRLDKVEEGVYAVMNEEGETYLVKVENGVAESGLAGGLINIVCASGEGASQIGQVQIILRELDYIHSQEQIVISPIRFRELASSFKDWGGKASLRVGNKPVIMGEGIGETASALCESSSISRHEAARICIEKGVVSGEEALDEINTVLLVFSDGNGLCFAVNYCPEAGIFVSGGSFWFRVSEQAERLLAQYLD